MTMVQALNTMEKSVWFEWQSKHDVLRSVNTGSVIKLLNAMLFSSSVLLSGKPDGRNWITMRIIARADSIIFTAFIL